MNNDLQKALDALVDATVHFCAACVDTVTKAFSLFDLSGVSDLFKQLTCNKQAYDLAFESNPKWVWFAKHHKKRRIRKKYHDKIIKTYGGTNERYTT